MEEFSSVPVSSTIVFTVTEHRDDWHRWFSITAEDPFGSSANIECTSELFVPMYNISNAFSKQGYAVSFIVRKDDQR